MKTKLIQKIIYPVSHHGADGKWSWFRKAGYNYQLHRDNDLPAQVFYDEVYIWRYNSNIHRSGGPAIISPDGRGMFYTYGRFVNFAA